LRLGFWTTIALALGILALAGCGDSKASEEELAKAYREGEQTGYTKARASEEDGIGIGGPNAEPLEEEEGGWRDEDQSINPTPEKGNGEPSDEFEPEDIERAEEASQSVKEYCEGAVSEAQEVGCLSHVEPSEVP
jgi:hypothetical protein